MMVIYEVNLTVQRTILVEYTHWLNEHIQQMLAIPGFQDAQLFKSIDQSDLREVLFVVHYQIESENALNHYFEHQAPEMRADGLRRFGSQFTATRRILSPTQSSFRYNERS